MGPIRVAISECVCFLLASSCSISLSSSLCGFTTIISNITDCYPRLRDMCTTPEDKQIWHFNLIFQVTCVGQLSQFLRCLFICLSLLLYCSVMWAEWTEWGSMCDQSQLVVSRDDNILQSNTQCVYSIIQLSAQCVYFTLYIICGELGITNCCCHLDDCLLLS